MYSAYDDAAFDDYRILNFVSDIAAYLSDFVVVFDIRVNSLSLEIHAISHPSIDLAETFPLLRRTRFISRVLLLFVDKPPSTSLRTCSSFSAAGKMSSRNRAKIEPFAPAFPSGA